MEEGITRIKVSKYKLILAGAGMFSFISGGFQTLNLKNDPSVFQLVAGSLSILFGVFFLVLFIRFLVKEDGLQLSSDGIFNASGGLNGYWVPWSDITEVKTITFLFQPVVLIYVNNPLEYIESNQGLTRYFLRTNYRRVGTPINISAIGLKITEKELVELIKSKQAEYTSHII